MSDTNQHSNVASTLLHFPKNDTTKLVSIFCLTFNHAPYIRQCLDGFLMQKTNFHFEVIVHDDASTDKTADIIKEYAAKYPNVIIPIFETTNMYSQIGFGRLFEIMIDLSKGKYIALCEGDDYWTDPMKLQKQIDFLESHSEYSMCFHNAIVHHEDGNVPDHLFLHVNVNREYTGLEILENWTVPTASTVLRKEVVDSQKYEIASKDKRFIYGDIILFLSAAECGKIYYLANTMSVYRRHQGAFVSHNSLERDLRGVEHDKAILEIFGNKYQKTIRHTLTNKYFSFISRGLKRGKIKFASSYLCKSVICSPRYFFQLCVSRIASQLHMGHDSTQRSVYTNSEK